MRVIAGEHGGRRLLTLPGRALRPTLDRVRESLFSILGDDVEGARALDLFAGTGALGIEALSRGAASALFVDADARALAVLRKNLAALGLERRARAQQAKLPRALKTLLRAGPAFDIIFADPPYRTSLARETIELLAAAPWFPGWRCVVVETEKEADVTRWVERAAGARVSVDRRVYGDTAISLLRPAPDGDTLPERGGRGGSAAEETEGEPDVA
jgi:16S rRNA (guanine(966)-N(2))-methyltransferase RsmD